MFIDATQEAGTPSARRASNHEVVETLRTKLLYSATLGTRRAMGTTQTGVVARLRAETDAGGLPCAWATATTPLGLRKSSLLFPRIAEYSNPGLEDESRSGKMSKLRATGGSRTALPIRVARCHLDCYFATTVIATGFVLSSTVGL